MVLDRYHRERSLQHVRYRIRQPNSLKNAIRFALSSGPVYAVIFWTELITAAVKKSIARRSVLVVLIIITPAFQAGWSNGDSRSTNQHSPPLQQSGSIHLQGRLNLDDFHPPCQEILQKHKQEIERA